MTHAEAFANVGPDDPRNPTPNFAGRLDMVGRYWGKELVEAMKVRHLYECRRCHALIGFVGDALVWTRKGDP